MYIYDHTKTVEDLFSMFEKKIVYFTFDLYLNCLVNAGYHEMQCVVAVVLGAMSHFVDFQAEFL